MRHLIGIVSYKITESLRCLVELLHKDQDIVLLVDKKTNIKTYELIKDKVLFLPDRIEINWGTFSQVEATLNLMRYSIDKEYDYFSLISESDLPLKNSQEMNEFLENHRGKEFIGFVPEVTKNTIENIKFSYFSVLQGRKNYIRKLYKFFKINRLFRNPNFSSLPKIYKGSNWFTLSNKALNGIFEYIDSKPDYVKAFKHSFLSDEIFFHTILRDIFPEEAFYALSERDELLSSLRYIDWGNQSGPNELLAEKVLTYRYESPNSFFFRKVSTESDFSEYLKIMKEEIDVTVN